MNESESALQYWAELIPWIVPTILGAVLTRRSPRGERLTWGMVTAVCAVILVDKAVDLVTPLTEFGRWVVQLADPETRFRTQNLYMRVLLLGSLFLSGCLGLCVLLRMDRSVHTPKWISLSGIVLLMAYMAARLVPAIGQHIDDAREWIVQGTAWAIVIIGILLGFRKETRRTA